MIIPKEKRRALRSLQIFQFLEIGETEKEWPRGCRKVGRKLENCSS